MNKQYFTVLCLTMFMTQASTLGMQMDRDIHTLPEAKKLIQKQDQLIAELNRDLADANQGLYWRKICLQGCAACCLCSCSYNLFFLHFMNTQNYNNSNCKTT